MDEELPNEFDLVVIGTGFPESCVAAAASRIGKTVLHIDPNEYYGGAWASFNLDTYNTFLLANGTTEIRNAHCEWHIPKDVPEKEEGEEDENAGIVWSIEKLMKLSRKFNLDLCPKIVFSSGTLVQLLISSNICRYTEFRAVDRIYTLFKDQLLTVPCSRSDVFNTKDLNIIEKRLLMKFLTNCMAYGDAKCEDDWLEYRGKTFAEYLRHQKVTEKITQCVMQAIAMSMEDSSFEEGMERTKKFLQSLGRYGNTPFIFPMYGCGEIPQCFCRLCAVFGGVYCLKREITALNIVEHEQEEQTQSVTVQIDGKQVISAKNVVCSPANIPAQLRAGGSDDEPKHFLSRALFLSSSPLGNNEESNSVAGGGVNLLRMLTADAKREAILVQLSQNSGTCPKGIYLLHITTLALSNNPVEDIKPFAEQVFNANNIPLNSLLYSSYFTISGYGLAETYTSSSVLATAPAQYELDYDRSIENAQSIFTKLYGATNEFLPRAPDPEEIVIDGEDPKALIETQLPEDLREQLRQLASDTEKMDIVDEQASESVVAENKLNETIDDAMEAD